MNAHTPEIDGPPPCPVCGARGPKQECATVTGRDHQARQRAEIAWRDSRVAPPSEQRTEGGASDA